MPLPPNPALSPRICYISKNVPGAIHAFLSCSQCDRCSAKLPHFLINATPVWTTLLIPIPSKPPGSLLWLLWAVSGALWYSISGFNSLSEVLNPNLHSLVKFKSWNVYSLSIVPHVLLLPKPPCRPAVLPSRHFVAFLCTQRYNRDLWDQTEPLTTEDLMSPHCKVSNLKHWGGVAANISFDDRFYWHHKEFKPQSINSLAS